MHGVEFQALTERAGGVGTRALMLFEFRGRDVTQHFGDGRGEGEGGLRHLQRFLLLLLWLRCLGLLLLLLFAMFFASSDGFQFLVENHILEFDSLRAFPGGFVHVVDRVGAEQPSRLQAKLDRLTAAAENVRVQGLGHVVHLNVHEHDLGQVEIDVRVGEGEHLVGKIRVHTRFLRSGWERAEKTSKKWSEIKKGGRKQSEKKRKENGGR